MMPLSWYPREMEAWRAFEEGESPIPTPPPDWPYRRQRRRPAVQQIRWMPSLDIVEKDNGYIIRVELPGINREDLDISVTGNTLTIKGERRSPAEEKAGDYQCNEICYGTFYRSIIMPPDVDTDKIEVDYTEGILELSLPKVPEIRPKKIEVTVKK